MRSLFLVIFVMITLPLQTVMAQDSIIIIFPADYQTTTCVNIRAQHTASARKIGVLNNGDTVSIEAIDSIGKSAWGKITMENDRNGYVCMRYLTPVITIEKHSNWAMGLWETIKSWLISAKKWVRIAFIIVIVILIIIFRDLIGAIIGSYLMGAILGALIGLFFGGVSNGASIGCWVVTACWALIIINRLGFSLFSLPLKILLLPFVPFYLLNQLQWCLIAPWRWLFRTNWMNDSVKKFIRPVCTFLTIVLTIAATPLRLFNAVVYNISHFLYDLYNYIVEIFVPSSDNEGREGWLSWIFKFIWRFIKYPIFNGCRSLLDSVVYTIIDIFVPAVTMYHGTCDIAADSILADKRRNEYQKCNTDVYSGNFKSSTAKQRTWGGLGVYFAKSASLAGSYAADFVDGTLIVCRVSYGLIINYNLAPDEVAFNTGQYGNHARINEWTMPHGYTTGEWWNGHVWEYIMFDWQNGYNSAWRIRPLYAINVDTHFFHRIKGGMRHWV